MGNHRIKRINPVSLPRKEFRQYLNVLGEDGVVQIPIPKELKPTVWEDGTPVKFPNLSQEVTISIFPHGEDLKYVRVTMKPTRERPLPAISEVEVDTVPDSFRCFMCGGKFSKKQLGGVELQQTICKACYPSGGTGWTGRLVYFDRRKKQPIRGEVQGEPKRKRVRPRTSFIERKPRKE